MTANPIQLQRFLRGVDYPADKKTLVDSARANGAPQDVVDTLMSLSRNRFNSPNDVSEILGRQN
jgi:hypothetical protein